MLATIDIETPSAPQPDKELKVVDHQSSRSPRSLDLWISPDKQVRSVDAQPTALEESITLIAVV